MKFDVKWKEACQITGLKGGALTYAVRKGSIFRSKKRPYMYCRQNLEAYARGKSFRFPNHEYEEVAIFIGQKKYIIIGEEEYLALVERLHRNESVVSSINKFMNDVEAK